MSTVAALETQQSLIGPRDEDRIREFPILGHKRYFASCSYGAQSVSVRRGFDAFLDDQNETGCNWEVWLGKYEEIRDSFARMLSASRNEIAVTTSASAGVNALASALDVSGKRNKIILSDFEFPTVAQIWHAQDKRGANVVHISEDDGAIPLERFEAEIDDTTAIVAIAQVCYRNGARNDVEAIIELAHSHGAFVLLDTYQSVGTMPIDAKALNVDAICGGNLKYLLGPAGLGFLYVRSDHVDRLVPTTSGWFAQADIEAMDIYANQPAPTARRFEMGTPPIPNIYAGLVGLEILHNIGFDRIRRHVLDLTDRFKAGVLDEGFKLVTPGDPDRHGAMIAVRSTDDHALVARLMEQGIVTSCRDNNVRFSFHLYNTAEDVDVALEALSGNRDLLA